MKTLHNFSQAMVAFAMLLGCDVGLMRTSTVKAQAPVPSYPSHLPYKFDNFVWWSDDELRALLKKRIPGLGDELETTHVAEGRVRAVLTALLKEKGVIAEVQSQEPGPSSFMKFDAVMFGKHQAESPHPSILFLVRSPAVVIGRVNFKDVPQEAEQAISVEAHAMETKPFGSFGIEFADERLGRVLTQSGYLDATVHLERQMPRREGDKYLVDLTLTANLGPKYRIAELSADGGPLLQGRDLSRFFALKPGDLATKPPFGSLVGELQSFYTQKGYADVDVDNAAVKVPEKGLVSYRLTVDPGPLYHLRKLEVKNLNAETEARVRVILGMKPGDVYDEGATSRVYHSLPTEPLLKGLEFSFSPRRDQPAAAVDLTLDFHKQGGEATVTTH